MKQRITISFISNGNWKHRVIEREQELLLKGTFYSTHKQTQTNTF